MATKPNEQIFDASPHSTLGLTKREYFAALALQGLLAHGGDVKYDQMHQIAESATIWADELITALSDDE